jgi:hypothetical protein
MDHVQHQREPDPPGDRRTLEPGKTRAFKHTGGNIWNNRETDPGALYDPQGRLVSYWADR